MRLPVLATGVGGIPDLFREREGWYPIQAPPSRGQLTGTLLEIIERGARANVDLRRRMADNSVSGLDRGWTSAQLAAVLDEVRR